MKNLLNLIEVSDDRLLIIGRHGIGKTQQIEGWAEEKGYFCKTLLLSQMEIGDLIGIPYVTSDNKTKWAEPHWLTELKTNKANGKRPVLFLDELNRAMTDIRQSALQLILEKKIFSHELPADTIVVSAINPSGDYQVDELDPALIDRFLVVNYEPNVKEWLDWAEKSGIHRIVRNFISNKNKYLAVYNDEEMVTPTPRSWAKLSDNLIAFEEMNMDDDTMLLRVINGKVGKVIGAEFYNYYKEHNKYISLEDVVNTIKGKSLEKDLERVKDLLADTEIENYFELLDTAIQEDEIYAFTCMAQNLEIEKAMGYFKSLKEKDEKLYFQITRKFKDEFLKKGGNPDDYIIVKIGTIILEKGGF